MSTIWTMIDRDDAEWEAAWAALDERVDREHVDPATGERWEYMGSVRQSDGWVHQFRHRRYAGRGRDLAVPGRTNLQVPASDSFQPTKVAELGGGLVGRMG